jgi:hypothetical protein
MKRFACNVNGLTARYQELSRALFSAIQDKSELRDGYAFRLPSASLMTVAEWVSLERKCCPFFAFGIEQPKDQGPVWLRITGPEGVKAFIEEELQP